MFKRFGVLLVVCGAVLWGSSCLSIPPKISEDDCLVIVKNDIEMSGGDARFIFDYYLGLSVGNEEVIVPKSKDYFAVVVREPNVKVKAVIARLSTGGLANGADQVYDADLPLPYKAGSVIVASFAVVRKVVHNGNGYGDYLTLKKVSPQEKADLKAQLVGEKNFSTWEAPSNDLVDESVNDER